MLPFRKQLRWKFYYSLYTAYNMTVAMLVAPVQFQHNSNHCNFWKMFIVVGEFWGTAPSIDFHRQKSVLMQSFRGWILSSVDVVILWSHRGIYWIASIFSNQPDYVKKGSCSIFLNFSVVLFPFIKKECFKISCWKFYSVYKLCRFIKEWFILVNIYLTLLKIHVNLNSKWISKL